ncbi:hypothetical protein [Actinotignum sp. GS-2025c]|uniref:hypothetical protein n=1 Tax=Actinotignum sp. GS-2025c TaxID=3427276 RepID=UPI003F45584B
MKMTKKEALRFLADPTETIYPQLLRTATIEAWSGATLNANLAEYRLSSDTWKTAGDRIIQHGTAKDRVDLFFLLAETQDHLARLIKLLDKVKDTHKTETEEQ